MTKQKFVGVDPTVAAEILGDVIDEKDLVSFVSVSSKSLKQWRDFIKSKLDKNCWIIDEINEYLDEA